MTVVGSRARAKDLPVPQPAKYDGRVPPHDLDAEAAVLSACMLGERNAFVEVADILAPEKFYSESHRRIYEAIVALEAKGQPIDVVTVAGHLKDHDRLQQIGGMPYLGQILDGAPVLANVRTYAKRVAALAKQRAGILVCQRYMARGFDEREDPDKYVADLEADVQKLAEGDEGDRSIEMRPLLTQVYGSISKAWQDGRPPGIATGFRSFDDLTVGLHRKELTLVAARPGMGKTSLLLSVALNIAGADPLLLADDGEKWMPQGCAFFSLEMPREQIGQRFIAIESRVSAHRMRTGRVTEDDWSPMTYACHRMATMPIDVDDTSAMWIGRLRAKVRRTKAKMKSRGQRLTVVFVDYLQLMRGEDVAGRRVEEIGQISRGLKQLAKDEDVAVVAGCQLNRALETRNGPDKRPRVSDLRESGDLEQDADNIVFIYRGEVYGEKPPEGEEGKTELIVAKQRNGPTGTAIVRYVAGCTRFEEMPTY